jgi:hypothetical protein
VLFAKGLVARKLFAKGLKLFAKGLIALKLFALGLFA